MPINILKNSLSKLSQNILELDESEFVYKSFRIQCKDLPVPNQEGNIYTHNLFKNLFDELETTKREPYVYWFEVKEGPVCNEIRNCMSIYNIELKNELNNKLQHIDRRFYSIPAMTKGIKDLNSRILYVGKVKGDLKGRLVPHLGYYHRSPNTQGLQLARWATDKNLTLEFHYIKLPKELRELTSYLEFKLANEFRPILGRHSN